MMKNPLYFANNDIVHIFRLSVLIWRPYFDRHSFRFFYVTI